MLAVVVAVVVMSAVVCLWGRRRLRKPEDKAVTVGVALMAVSIVLIFPQSDLTVGEWLHHLTGVWYLNVYLSLVALMAAVCYLTRSAALRLDFGRLGWVMRQVAVPAAVAAALMLVELTNSPIARRPQFPGQIMYLPHPWLASMWICYAIAQIWQLSFLLWILLMLRKERESRAPTYWFIATTIVGIATEGIVIAAQFTTAMFGLRWYGTLLAITCAVIGGAMSLTQRAKDRGEDV